MSSRSAAMQLAKAEAEDYLRAALQILEATLDEKATPEQVGRTHDLATSYVQLGGEAIERFMEAAR